METERKRYVRFMFDLNLSMNERGQKKDLLGSVNVGGETNPSQLLSHHCGALLLVQVNAVPVSEKKVCEMNRSPTSDNSTTNRVLVRTG